MKYAIQINAGPFGSQAAHTAYQFIKAALDKGYEIVSVFFYHDGVYNGLQSGLSAEDRRSVPPWSELAGRHGIELVLCVSAAQRRGMPTSGTDGFRIGGLGQWMDACLKADRVLVFGD
ncbi:sulfurtransferase complex subunit TusD [Methylocaldum sp. MU1018]